ncbi:hypothetical protein Btru_012573 [Bulinus truncatus]|nr:hypothetical protein Btru_012573 [Bulinus truncatus]
MQVFLLREMSKMNGAAAEKNAPNFSECRSDKTIKKSTSEFDVSETFITIETKDGQSSEKIPFAQFLKQVVVDKESGNLKVDFSQLMVTSCNTPKIIDEAFPPSSEKNTYDVTNLSSVSSEECSTHSLPVNQTHSELASMQDKPIKKRGRPPKNKTALDAAPKPLSNGSSHTIKTHLPDISNHIKDTALRLQAKESSSAPRRSSRTPAKNSRFNDDYVNSLTLGKVSSSSSTSSSSTWNTQLMTLALAAERHKNKPNKSNVDNVTSDNNQYDTDVSGSSVKKESLEKKNDDSDCREDKLKQPMLKIDNGLVETDSVSSNDKFNKCEEKAKKYTIRGPKTLKKYEPVDPVVRRTLQEALIQVTETTRGHLSLTKPEIENSDCSNPTVYYTIMEPKMAPIGHGLLVQKIEDKVNFRVVEFEGDLVPNSEQVSKTYPQDRYFSCDLCSKICPSISAWLLHSKHAHNRTVNTFEKSPVNLIDKQEFVCEFCHQRFPYRFMLDTHIKRKRHSEVKSFRCTLCREGFISHKEREEHWMTHHPARSCGLCGKQFTNIVMLRRHINNNCHGARFRKAHDTDSLNAEDNMVISDTKARILLEDDDIESGEEIVDYVPKETENEDEDDDIEEEDESSKQENEKVKCGVCELEFSTSSGLWHHKLEEHREFYPEGFRETLQEKLKRNESILSGAHSAEIQKNSDSSKNKFFIVMRPAWPADKPKLTISVEDKEFFFKPSSSKINGLEALPQNSYMDAPFKKETTFECLDCSETFYFASSYREHRSRVHGECFEILRLLGAFQCTLCSETYPCQFMLDKHTKRHVGKKVLPCTLCGVFFHKIQDRRLHWKTVHPGIGCPNCGKMYASIKYLQKHISLNCQDHFPPTKKFLEFQKKQHSDFEMSKNEKKVEKKIIRCHLCPKICSSIHGWRRHMSEVHEDAGFSKLSNTCIICNELVYGYKALEKHLLQNHAEDSGLPVEEEEGLVEEALKNSEIDITTYRKAGKNTSEIYQDEEGNYHCPSCSKVHSDLKALRTHIRIHVNMNLKCSICHKTFKNPTLLKQHVQRHRKDAVYTCDTCNKKFLTLQKLNKHRKVHHNTGNFVCELCGMAFALNDYLQKHKRCHTDKRPHCCTICGKMFRTKPELRVHVLIHTRETPYKCQYCSRGFSQKGNYRIHLAQHTGEKPYQCDQCEISFALLCHLKRHKITHDQKINYRCIWCDKECTQRKHMQMHVQRVHKEDFYQYEEQMKLETPIPIAPSQAKLYNRRLGKVNKVRRQYRTKAQKCDSTIQQLMNGVVAKTEMIDEDMEASEDIVIEPLVEHMIKTSHENGGYEILVSDDHQSYAKHSISNVEIVMGENNEINIIIKDPSTFQDVIGDSLEAGPVHIHETLQHAVEAFVDQAKAIHEDGQRAIAVFFLLKIWSAITTKSSKVITY